MSGRSCLTSVLLALPLTIGLPAHAFGQAPEVTAARLAALAAESTEWRSFGGSAWLDPAPFQLHSTPTGMARNETPFPARTSTEVEAMAKAAGARIAGQEQMIRCVSESTSCTLPPTGTLLLEIGDPIVEGARATVLLRSRVVGSFPNGAEMHLAVRAGSIVRYTLDQQDGRWHVVKRDVLVIG